MSKRSCQNVVGLIQIKLMILSFSRPAAWAMKPQYWRSIYSERGRFYGDLKTKKYNNENKNILSSVDIEIQSVIAFSIYI